MIVRKKIRLTYIVDGEQRVEFFNNKGQALKKLSRTNGKIVKAQQVYPKLHGRRVVFMEQQNDVQVCITAIRGVEAKECGGKWLTNYKVGEGEWCQAEIWVELADAKLSGVEAAYFDAEHSR